MSTVCLLTLISRGGRRAGCTCWMRWRHARGVGARIGRHVYANNGCIWNGDTTIDFTLPCDIARDPANSMLATALVHDAECLSVYSDGAGTDAGSLLASGKVDLPPSRAASRNRRPTPLCSASTPYMRRSLVVWGDCVKLRYGAGPEASPWLWGHMTAYVEMMSRIFHGFRLDNSHGTPLHVLDFLSDAARIVRGTGRGCARAYWVNARAGAPEPLRDR